ncbi:MAG: TrbI/VirB10 family protein [Verrucomicrobiota bacterium]
MDKLKPVIKFLKSSDGILAVFGVIVVVGFLVWKIRGVDQTKIVKNYEKLTSEKAKPVTSLSEVKSVSTGIPEVRNGLPQKAPEERQYSTSQIQKTSPIDLFTAKEDPVGPEYAPYGAVLKCVLVYTIDSNNLQTPIVGMVLEDYWHDGKLIVPAGTYANGFAQSSNIRDRIGSQNQWMLVWRNRDEKSGFQLPVTGIALDYSPEVGQGTFKITDGSAGLRGRVKSNVDEMQAWAIITKGIQQASEAYVQKNLTISNGSVTSSQNGGIKDALAMGAAGMAQQGNQNIQQSIQQATVFVRVPAGKEFYLYVTQVIDLSKGKIGATFTQTSTGK